MFNNSGKFNKNPILKNDDFPTLIVRFVEERTI